ncbi:MAG: FAD-dependent 5-carboxymethylaminomethyl-2-thiouridine(34) oxidoreductase MnmC, partial [Emcibacteraceae bacterium]|nr:FAD-dependent 5-carboxymethylaminomethyl-2-thiouridine(34) oxidoreductase MnmC [Emcibacteraceae bacterium]
VFQKIRNINITMTSTTSKPWYASTPKINKNQKIAVIGGGIAGVFAAHHLMKQGYEVVLIEESDKLLNAASGNPAAILDPFISNSGTIEKEFYLKAYTYAIETYKTFGADLFNQCGLQKIARSDAEASKFEITPASYPEGLMTFKDGVLTFPQSGYVQPHLISDLMQTELSTILETNVSRLMHNDDQQWSLLNDQNELIIKANAVIICNAHQASHFEQSSRLPLERMSGQISYISPQTAQENVLCSTGYLTPTVQTDHGEIQICGATFDKGASLEITDAAHDKNIRQAPLQLSNPKIIGARREVRTMTPDHLPVVGPLPIYSDFHNDYHGLHHGPDHKIFPSASYYPNLFVNVGLGARGFLTAPLLGHYLASIITDTPSPFDEKIEHALHPARFLIRMLSKK